MIFNPCIGLNSRSIEYPIYLPEQRIVSLYTEPDCYGASVLISRSLHLPFTPRSFAYWLHGWNSIPLKYVEVFGVNYDGTYLVARKDEELFLLKSGKKAHAIGAPFVYTDNFISACDYKRIAGSLLIMPPHGMSYTTESWNEQMYIEEIHSVLKDFEYSAVCISPNDIEKNSWVGAFKKIGLPIIEGAKMSDANALIRMRSLFNQFEFVTTNSIGSHVAYAAYAGAKVSFYGKYQHLDARSLEHDDLYKAHPEILDFVVEHSSEVSVKERYGFLFCEHPAHAVASVDSAADWLGCHNMKEPTKVAGLLNWWPHQQLFQFSRKACNKVYRMCGE